MGISLIPGFLMEWNSPKLHCAMMSRLWFMTGDWVNAATILNVIVGYAAKDGRRES